MPVIDLRWGTRTIPFTFDDDRWQVIGSADERTPLSDVEIGERLDAPIGTSALEEIVNDGDSVLIVVPDATRDVATVVAFAGEGEFVCR